MKKPTFEELVTAASEAGVRVTTSLDPSAKVRAKKHVVVHMRRCPRCGGDHKKLKFTKLTYTNSQHSHWAPCPANGEPIMLTLWQ